MSLKPLYDRILVEPIEQEEKTQGGIFIPDTAKEKPMEGKVIAVGEGYRLENGQISPLKIKIGDIVVYGKWAGTEIKSTGKTLSIMKESDVLAIKSID